MEKHCISWGAKYFILWQNYLANVPIQIAVIKVPEIIFISAKSVER